MTAIDIEYSAGDEMNITINQNGKFQFNDDLSTWAKEFINGKNYFIDVAGPTKIATNAIEEFQSIDAEMSETESSVTLALTEIDNDRFAMDELSRKRIK